MAARTGGLTTYNLPGTALSIGVTGTGTLRYSLATMRNRTMPWSRVERTLERYSHAMAADLQEMVVDEYTRTRKRKDVSTGRLDAATLDRRNREVAKNGFSVGLESWLNKSQAKYWRQIEEGTRVHVGRHLYGVFGATFSGGYYPGNRWPWRNARYGPAWSFVGASTGGGFVPKKRLKKGVRSTHFAGPRQVGGGWPMRSEGGYSRATRMIIGRPIEAQNAYRRAYTRFRKENRAFNLFRQTVMAELGLTSDQVGKSYQSILAGVFQAPRG